MNPNCIGQSASPSEVCLSKDNAVVHDKDTSKSSESELPHDVNTDSLFVANEMNYGGPSGNGSTFTMSKEEYAKLSKKEEKYKLILQKVLDLADIKIDGDRPFDVVIHNPLVFRRVLSKGSMGFGTAFMDGWWDTRDFYSLHIFFKRLLSGGLEYYFPNNAKDLMNIIRAKMSNLQSRKKSREVRAHYNTGNAFFANMLGRTMQYSCAYWQVQCTKECEGSSSSGDIAFPRTREITSLDEAQDVKLKMIGDKLNLKAGMEVLDVGCGWGTLAEFLSKTYQVKVTGITISEEQRNAAAERNKDNPNVTILVRDYRDLSFCKKFDRIVSVGMFEHVGPKNYRVFFKHMRRLIRDDDPEAVFLLHTIGSNTTMSYADPWYLKYIFPGGCLPSIQNLGKSIEKLFVMEDWHNFGYFYGHTLMAWRENFLRGWNSCAERKRTDADQFFRMFYYYLSSSAGAFYARDLQLWQIILTPHGVPRYINAPRP